MTRPYDPRLDRPARWALSKPRRWQATIRPLAPAEHAILFLIECIALAAVSATAVCQFVRCAP